MATVEFRNVTRIYPGMSRPAVDRLDLQVRDGELLVFVGPSGCGKSTVLRMLAGLEPVDSGRILIDGDDVTGLPPEDRNIAMVFQTYALFPYMTVEENIAFHLRLRRERPDEIRRRVDDVANMLGITELLDRKPSKLSGGQRQRVAMGRALIRHPSVFLMDEPLSNLDAKLRLHMRTDIATLQKRLGTTTIYVTHDPVEAMTFGDRVAVQRDGVLYQCAPPMELYEQPVNEFVAGFIGSPAMNLFPARVCCGVANAEGLQHRLTRAQANALSSDRISLGVRPEAWNVACTGGLKVTANAVESLGAEAYVHCSSPTIPELIVRTKRCDDITVGARLSVRPDSDRVHVFDGASGQRVPQ